MPLYVELENNKEIEHHHDDKEKNKLSSLAKNYETKNITLN